MTAATTTATSVTTATTTTATRVTTATRATTATRVTTRATRVTTTATTTTASRGNDFQSEKNSHKTENNFPKQRKLKVIWHFLLFYQILKSSDKGTLDVGFLPHPKLISDIYWVCAMGQFLTPDIVGHF